MAETSNISRTMLWDLAHSQPVIPVGDLGVEAFQVLLDKGFVVPVEEAGAGTFAVSGGNYAVTVSGYEKVYRTSYREMEKYKRVAEIEASAEQPALRKKKSSKKQGATNGETAGSTKES